MAKKNLVSWLKAKPTPLAVVSGSEAVLVRKTLERISAKVDPDVERVRLDASHYEPGALLQACMASLFSAQKYVVVDSLESMSDDFLADALSYTDDANPDAVVVFLHGGGNRGAKLLKALAAQGAPTYDASPLKTDAQKSDFANGEFKRAGRSIEPDAFASLMSALSADVSELAAGIEQLLMDTEGTIDRATVERYYAGRIEASGFKVADAAVAGKRAEALGLLRHALETGTDPVPLVATVAMKLRQLAKVSGMRGSAGQLAGELKMAPWQIDKARRELRYWSPEALGDALMLTAWADHAVKGGGRDPEYAVERLILGVAEYANQK